MPTKTNARIAIAKAPTNAATPNKAFVVFSFGPEGAGACTFEFTPFAFSPRVGPPSPSVGDDIGGVVESVATVGDKVNVG
jgi:hypothetical protein